MCKFESSQKDESRWQSTDSSKAYRNTSAFKCIYIHPNNNFEVDKIFFKNYFQKNQIPDQNNTNLTLKLT